MPALKCEVDQLKFEVERIKHDVAILASLIDADSLAAANRLRQISPTNAQLKVWAQASQPPEDLVSQQEERPW